jgi:hypothetical protein
MIRNLRMGFPNLELLASSDFLNNSKRYWRTQFKFTGRCVICGSKDHVEMHTSTMSEITKKKKDL